MNFLSLIRTVPNFPEQGILFRDLTPVFLDAKAFGQLIDAMADHCERAQVDLIAGIEARGFILGSAVARALKIGFLPVRKAGKLPPETEKISYSLEYGEASLELPKDLLQSGKKVMVLDDVIATGGTAIATIQLLQRLKMKPQGVFAVIDLLSLGGSAKIREKTSLPVHTLLQY